MLRSEDRMPESAKTWRKQPVKIPPYGRRREEEREEREETRTKTAPCRREEEREEARTKIAPCRSRTDDLRITSATLYH